MAYFDDDQDELQRQAAEELANRRLQAQQHGAGVRPRLIDRVQDDAETRNAPPSMPNIGGGGATMGAPPTMGTPSTTTPPPLPSNARIFTGGMAGQRIPPGVNASLKQRMLGAAGGGLMGAVQAGLNPSRVFNGRTWEADPYQAEAQRQGGRMGLQTEAERYAQPQQTAQIAGEQARTEGQTLQNKITQRRLEMMQNMDPNSLISSLGELSGDEQAVINAGQQESTLKGDITPLMQSVDRIAQMRAVSGRIGGGVNVADPNSSTGVSRQLYTRGGKTGPSVGSVPGAVVPSMLPETTNTTKIVTTPQGPMSTPITTTRQKTLPGELTGKGGGGGGRTGAGNLTPMTGAGGQVVVGKELNDAQKNYQDINTLEFEQQKLLTQAEQQGGTLNGPQSMQFLANHLSLTVGRVKGARSGKDIIEKHIAARSVPQDLRALADSVLQGGVIPYSQAAQMHDTAHIKALGALREFKNMANGQGYDVQVNDATGAVRVVPRAR